MAIDPPLSELSANVSQGLPAAAATDRAWHVLVHEADEGRTWIRIYSAAHGELRFENGPEIASRRLSSNDIMLMGNYQLN